jgi:hypothetical protein
MFIHVVPKLHHMMANSCKLTSVKIPEINLDLKEDLLGTGRPFPNKKIFVGMKKNKNKKAIIGFIVETKIHLKSFTVISTWKIENFDPITHIVTNYVEDEDFDMISQDSLLCAGFNGHANRIHPYYRNIPPAVIDPRMESLSMVERKSAHDTYSEYAWGNFLQQREENYRAMTIPSTRLKNEFSLIYHDRLPDISSAFCF